MDAVLEAQHTAQRPNSSLASAPSHSESYVFVRDTQETHQRCHALRLAGSRRRILEKDDQLSHLHATLSLNVDDTSALLSRHMLSR